MFFVWIENHNDTTMTKAYNSYIHMLVWHTLCYPMMWPPSCMKQVYNPKAPCPYVFALRGPIFLLEKWRLCQACVFIMDIESQIMGILQIEHLLVASITTHNSFRTNLSMYQLDILLPTTRCLQYYTCGLVHIVVHPYIMVILEIKKTHGLVGSFVPNLTFCNV